MAVIIPMQANKSRKPSNRLLFFGIDNFSSTLAEIPGFLLLKNINNPETLLLHLQKNILIS